MCINSPSLNRAILGDEGGKGTILDLAVSVASLSTPAKTVAKLSGVIGLDNEIFTAGLAFAAAQPHTELTTISVVPFFLSTLLTSSETIILSEAEYNEENYNQ